jgi:hypothetical protein
MFESPIPIGPFLIAESGQLTLCRPEPAPGFSFIWRGIGCTVKLTAGTMVLRAQAGRIPSTADGKALRDEALAVLRALPSFMPLTLRLRLLPDYRIQMEAETPLAWPMTAAALISPIVSILLRMAPAIDLLGEAGLGLR